MKNQVHAYSLLFILLIQSCKVYQTLPVTLQQAYEAKSEVRIKDINGGTTYYNSITYKDNVYYASTESTKIPIYPNQIEGVYLKGKRKKHYKIRVLFLDDREEMRGYLNNVTDSSIIISPTNNKFQLIDESSTVELPITEIYKIKKSVRQAAISGFIPEFVAGASWGIFGFLYAGNKLPIAMLAGIGIGSLVGLTTATISMGFAQKTYRINGDSFKHKTTYMPKLQNKSSKANTK